MKGYIENMIADIVCDVRELLDSKVNALLMEQVEEYYECTMRTMSDDMQDALYHKLYDMVLESLT
jgi:hypothetical protein